MIRLNNLGFQVNLNNIHVLCVHLTSLENTEINNYPQKSVMARVKLLFYLPGISFNPPNKL